MKKKIKKKTTPNVLPILVNKNKKEKKERLIAYINYLQYHTPSSLIFETLRFFL